MTKDKHDMITLKRKKNKAPVIDENAPKVINDIIVTQGVCVSTVFIFTNIHMYMANNVVFSLKNTCIIP
jgi:hypothetical protein